MLDGQTPTTPPTAPPAVLAACFRRRLTGAAAGLTYAVATAQQCVASARGRVAVDAPDRTTSARGAYERAVVAPPSRSRAELQPVWTRPCAVLSSVTRTLRRQRPFTPERPKGERRGFPSFGCSTRRSAGSRRGIDLVAGSLVIDTRDLSQHCDRDLWLLIRRAGVTASELPAVLDQDPWTSRLALLSDKLHATDSRPANDAAADFGTAMESKCVQQYIAQTGNAVTPTGLWTSHDGSLLLGASPDGIVHVHGTNELRLLEVKCPCKPLNDEELLLFVQKCTPQIQGQLECCDVENCDRLVRTAENIRVFTVLVATASTGTKFCGGRSNCSRRTSRRRARHLRGDAGVSCGVGFPGPVEGVHRQRD